MKTENLDRYFASQFDKGIAGCSFAMMLHGKLVYENYSGYADIEAKKPITPDTVFRMYSMTKLFRSLRQASKNTALFSRFL